MRVPGRQERNGVTGTVPLACTVRACGQPLTRGGRSWTCPRGHAFDVARTGYVNLLQPQDRRSGAAGDQAKAVDARARLLAQGVGRALVDETVRRAAALDVGDETPAVVDLGSGSGDLLGALASVRPVAGIGIDLSTVAAEHAARRFPDLTWVVANADRRLPLLDHSVTIVLSVHGRRNPRECARVLAPGGHLLVAVPAPDDLAELRERVQGMRVDRSRAETLTTGHAPFFTVDDLGEVRERVRLDRDGLLDLLRGTYRGERRSAAERIHALGGQEVTLASELFLFTLKERFAPHRATDGSGSGGVAAPAPAPAARASPRRDR
jgi:23S rRNA (guanine745-N1)-methyltransferase